MFYSKKKNNKKPARRSDRGLLENEGGKVFIAAEIFPPTVGGPATYAVNLANALQKRGYQVRILCYGKPDKTVLNKNIKINHVSNKWPLPIKYFLYFIYCSLFSIRYSLIYAMGPVASGWPAKCVKKITNKKLIVKVVGDYAWEQAMNSGKTNLLINEFQKINVGRRSLTCDQKKVPTGAGLETSAQQTRLPWKIKLLKNIEKKVCQSADTVITPSKYLKKIVSGWGVDEEKIKVIYNAYSPGFDSTSDQKIIREKNLIVSVGRLVEWKGFETLIKVIKELKDFKLLICGDGPLKNKLENLITELNLQDRVKIKKCNHDEVFIYLRKARVFVLNTAYEGLSHTILEGMKVFTPIISTKVGGNPELIKMGENGILVEYNNKEQLKNAILKLDKDPALQEKFVTNSKEVLKRFDFNKMINDTIQVLEK